MYSLVPTGESDGAHLPEVEDVTTLEDLPLDVLLAIYDYLSSKRDRDNLLLVSRRFRRLRLYVDLFLSYSVQDEHLVTYLRRLATSGDLGVVRSLSRNWSGCNQMRPMSREVLRLLPNLHGLESLSLQLLSGLTNGLLRSLSTLTRLQHLNLQNTSGYDIEGIGYLSGLTSLATLRLDGNYSGAWRGLDRLGSLTSLHELSLNIRGTPTGVDRPPVPRVARPSKGLYPSKSQPPAPNLDIVSVEPLLHLTSLRTLVLAECECLTDRDVGELATRLPTLTSLDISVCPSVSGRGLASLTSLRDLRRLVARGPTRTEVTSNLESIGYLTGLETLDIADRGDITTRTLEIITGVGEWPGLLKLRSLTISGDVSRRGPTGLLTRLTSLSSLGLGGCMCSITSETTAVLSQISSRKGTAGTGLRVS